MTIKPCTDGKKHKWAHWKDITIINESISAKGHSVRYSRRGVYKCGVCGKIKNGKALTGL